MPGISRGRPLRSRAIGQAAIVYGKRGDRVELVWCNTLDIEQSDTAGSFASALLAGESDPAP